MYFKRSTGQWDLIFFKRILTSGNSFSGLRKRFFIYFLEFSACDSLFLVQWKRSFQTNPSFWLVEKHFLASGNAYFIHFSDISDSDSFFLV